MDLCPTCDRPLPGWHRLWDRWGDLGGEILLGGYSSFQRLYHLDYIPLPGGDLAIRKPARMALAALWQAGLDWEPDLPLSRPCATKNGWQSALNWSITLTPFQPPAWADYLIQLPL